MTLKVALIDWTPKEDHAHERLLGLVRTHNTKIHVLYEGDNFGAFTYEDNVLDVLEHDDHGFDCEVFDSVEKLFERFDAEDEDDLIGSMEHQDRLIGCGDAEDDEEFAERLANLY